VLHNAIIRFEADAGNGSANCANHEPSGEMRQSTIAKLAGFEIGSTKLAALNRFAGRQSAG